VAVSAISPFQGVVEEPVVDPALFFFLGLIPLSFFSVTPALFPVCGSRFTAFPLSFLTRFSLSRLNFRPYFSPWFYCGIPFSDGPHCL